MHGPVRILSILFSVIAVGVFEVQAEQGLDKCASSFPGSLVTNAPKRSGVQADSGDTILICERSDDSAFFALEYDPEKYAPLWSAHRLGDTFGADGCASMTRKQMGCYFKAEDVDACLQGKGGGDPFHVDETLKKLDVERLSVGSLSKTGHDRGHMAPNSAFSWHVCGDYKTFTMSNMAAQWASLNQGLWAQLEAQVLFWAVKDGPLYVVTGPIWTKFPADRFKAVADGEVNMSTVPTPGTLLKRADNTKLSLDIPRPTGFYKVVFRPGRGGEPDRAIAFLVPHTKQKDLSFWEFLATVELVEDSAGLAFGFDKALKNKGATLLFGKPKAVRHRANGRRAPTASRTDCASPAGTRTCRSTNVSLFAPRSDRRPNVGRLMISAATMIAWCLEMDRQSLLMIGNALSSFGG